MFETNWVPSSAMAEVLGIHPQTLRKLRRHQITPFKEGRDYRWVGLSRYPTEVGEGPARTVNMPLKSAASAEADPPVVAAFLKRSDLMAAQFAQRLWVDAKNLRHCGGGHPIVFKHQGVK